MGWETIRANRDDITDYVIHLTRFVVDHYDGTHDVKSGFSRLNEIIRTGRLLPTFAHRTTLKGNRNKTIRGPHPAVCFTEQPLKQVPVTLRHSSAYEGYGVALHRVDLFNYGGRHAIYDSTMVGLLEDEQYRWVRYHPIKSGSADSPCDFTFEREWQCVTADHDMMPWQTKLGGIPLLLPHDFL